MIQGLVKPLNLLLAGYSYLSSSITKKPYILGMPPALGIELTNYCNLKCPECASGSGLMKRERGFMDLGLYNRIISELRPYLYNINLYFQGEPMMHPAFPSFIHYSAGIHTVISTNGHFLTRENCNVLVKSGLGRLIISLDGSDQSVYSSYREGGDFETVMDGLRILSEVRKQNRSAMKTEIQFLVNRMNEHQIPEVRRIASSVNASLKLKSMQIISSKSHERWLPEDRHYRRYEKNNSVYSIKSRLPGRCARLWFNPVVTWNGKVVPCCFDKDTDHVMGDLLEESFREIWNNSKYKLFRKGLLTDRKAIDICTNCTSGLKEAKY
jgi:radical SAM protein with 4Fe4S-binding SPASM domain